MACDTMQGSWVVYGSFLVNVLFVAESIHLGESQQRHMGYTFQAEEEFLSIWENTEQHHSKHNDSVDRKMSKYTATCIQLYPRKVGLVFFFCMFMPPFIEHLLCVGHWVEQLCILIFVCMNFILSFIIAL